ncbi:hypothetical protein R5M92_11335 [Halomonas sp. Bachu 37]|uniref:hypothetical protein n=1 Tax=Halomonas kashgarensis TaxID=3084920 RepID=UPI0032166FDD
MKLKGCIIALSISALASPAMAGSYEWTAGWGMGVSEYHVSDGNNNELHISCPDDEYSGYISATATINGKMYSSSNQSGDGFDVIVDGEVYSNPFFTDCRVCGDIFHSFWEPFRNANNLLVSVEGEMVRLPTTNLSDVLHPLESELNSCHASW